MQNLPGDSFVLAVKLLLSLNLLLMTPITMLPANRAIEGPLGISAAPLARSALRLAALAAIALLALLLPFFETMIGLVGAISGFTCFTMPLLCFIHVCSDRRDAQSVQ